MQKFRLHLLISNVQVQSNHNDDSRLMINISVDLALRLPFVDKKSQSQMMIEKIFLHVKVKDKTLEQLEFASDSREKQKS